MKCLVENMFMLSRSLFRPSHNLNVLNKWKTIDPFYNLYLSRFTRNSYINLSFLVWCRSEGVVVFVWLNENHTSMKTFNSSHIVVCAWLSIACVYFMWITSYDITCAVNLFYVGLYFSTCMLVFGQEIWWLGLWCVTGENINSTKSSSWGWEYYPHGANNRFDYKPKTYRLFMRIITAYNMWPFY